ncbi:hypothetical protein HanRHA438_Chr17g0806211 [Helianthus annuus]|nr:hypothetical protein HanRHA438_Chr17g0806211 [Helianthus annuus]
MHKNMAISRDKQTAIQVIILATCWIIWKSHNDLIFSGKRYQLDRMLGDIQAMTFLWVKSRVKKQNWSLGRLGKI